MKTQCDGACDEHGSRLFYVNVKDSKDGHDWGEFTYCRTAINEDERRGLIVTVINEKEQDNAQS